MEKMLTPELSGTLKSLRNTISRAATSLNLDDQLNILSLTNILDSKLIPMFSPDLPLLAAICGGGSSGKSTLFNAMVGKKISPTGGKSGINRKALVAAHEKYLTNHDFLSFLFEPFGCNPEPLKDISQLTSPGPPVYTSTKNLPPNLVLMDTPDFDTGSRGAYTNRDTARKALESADFFIYIFTNSNYNNRDNTDFIAKALTGIGKRYCFLVYRVYPSFLPEEITEHAMTVARNIYGDDAEKYVLGIYRADEDNSVAAGEKFMQLYAVSDDQPTLTQALQKIDSVTQRRELLKTILHDATQKADEILISCRLSLKALQLYIDALRAALSHCVQEALIHFPMDRVMKRFAQLWLSNDPRHIKVMRNTGNVVGFPFKVLVSMIKWAGKKTSENHQSSEKQNYKEMVEENLLTALNSLYQKVLSNRIDVSLPDTDPVTNRMCSMVKTISENISHAQQPLPKADRFSEKGIVNFSIPVHPALLISQEKLRQSDWGSTVKNVLEQQQLIVSFTESIDSELKTLGNQFRKKMGILGKSRQTFSALLNVVPATAAVSYILATGDPFGATGIKVKLSGLFGLQDLYALVAIPATTGLNKADRKQLETLLGPITQTWLNSKLQTVKNLFDQQITGEIIKQGETIISENEPVLKEIAEHIEKCKKAIEA
jgi:GTPase Era involved in 16S rRNA processing